MQVTYLATSNGSAARNCFVTTHVINECVAIDAGSLGLALDVKEQRKIRHVFLTHSHLDHLASLPLFLENVYDLGQDCVTLYGNAHVLECLQNHFFNESIWPDLVALSQKYPPFLKMHVLQPGEKIEVEGLQFTSIPVNHAVPTMGFLIEEEEVAVAIPSDTGPTEEFWKQANTLTHLKAVFLEAAFPERMEKLATIAKHLTPSMMKKEVQKIDRPIKIIALHLKPSFHDEIMQELLALGLPDLEIIEPGKVYHF
ncbi:MBL fold metallo-hydrolase [Planctomycetales bacterium 10988]|nr:MBL fold metallo-hydrolase [Planctomycetales bacterium 10988]